MDNVFTFYEAVEWSSTSHLPLAIMLLDFEKAYDRVDWEFLEGGVPPRWISGISALYRSSSSAVTIGGFVGQIFTLSGSVRQGCPLAPYLFLFFSEAMSTFLRSRAPQIHDLRLPVGIDEELLDSEFADDTMLYAPYSVDALDSIRDALDTFCLASGALINWTKSSGFLVGVEDACVWGQDVGFTWLAPGQSCRYLGFQIGIDVSSTQQFDPVLASIRRKLCHWWAMHLSLAGRALVVNQVLLATAWFITSCWMLQPRVSSQLKRLVRNFLWAGSDGTRDTRARVRWSTVILPLEEGGLGIINPEIQSRALISKLIVRGLFPGNEPWKAFLRSAVTECTLAGSGLWRPSYRYIFSDSILQFTVSPFMRSLLSIWSSMRRSLIQRPPQLIEEFERQPLIWNQRVRDSEGR